MTFRREKIKDYFLLDTSVENLFINEYMASAPGDFVKVYLFAQMYADLGQEITNEEIAKYLSMEHEDVLRAWTYWEKMGVIRKIRRESADKFDYDVEFVLLKEQFYGDKESKRPVGLDQSMQAAMGDKEIQEMFQAIEKASGSVLSGTEMLEIVSWINDFNATPEVIAYGYAYCVKRKKTNIKYIAAVINGWTQRGFRDVAAVEKYLSEADKKNHMYKRIFQALGFSRNATEQERKIMDTWFEEMEFSLDKVLEACSKTTGIANPNINYVNKVLVNWYEDRTGKDKSGKRKELTLTEISQYYETLRHKEEKEAEAHRREVYAKVPRIKQIDDELAAGSRELSRIIISDTVDKREVSERIKETASSLNTEKAFLLTDNGFELDYMDIHYECPLCKDTGMLETGEKCQCFGEVSRTKIEQLMQE